jgi:hypothetical protein
LSLPADEGPDLGVQRPRQAEPGHLHCTVSTAGSALQCTVVRSPGHLPLPLQLPRHRHGPQAPQAPHMRQALHQAPGTRHQAPDMHQAPGIAPCTSLHLCIMKHAPCTRIPGAFSVSAGSSLTRKQATPLHQALNHALTKPMLPVLQPVSTSLLSTPIVMLSRLGT